MTSRPRRLRFRAATFRMAVCGVLGLAASVGNARAQSADDLFNPAVMHRLDVRMNSQDWEKLKQDFQENTYYPADIAWNGQTARNSGVRSRGLGSRSGTKPGLRVDFDRYSTDQTFLGLKSIVLDNLTQDASGVKESVAMRMFARMGVPAPRESFARVFVNNQLIGLYAVVESVDKDLLARVYGSIDDDVQNDGYLFEYNYMLGSPWRFDYLGADLDAYSPRFDPKTHENKSATEKWGPIEELVRLVNETPSGSLPGVLEPRLNVPAFLRYMAVQNFVAQEDGFTGYDGMNNFYFYRLEDSPRHALIAWDEDNAFARADFGITTRHDENVLMRKVMASPGYSTQYFTALQEAAASARQPDEGQSEGWLQGEVRRQLDLIADAMREDPSKPFTNDEFEAARLTMLDFPGPRVSYVTCEATKALGQSPAAGVCP
jgi:spore coat protein CotH